MKLSSVVANAISENYKEQSRTLDFDEYKKLFIKSTTYQLKTAEKLSQRFKLEEFFLSRSAYGDRNSNTILLSPFYSFIFEKCLRNCFSIFKEIDFEEIISSTFDIKESLSLLQDDIFLNEDTDSSKISLFSTHSFYYNDNSNILDKEERMNKILSQVFMREFEEITDKIHNLVLSNTCVARSYFIIKEERQDTKVLFMDMDEALESIDIDDFSGSISRFQFNDYDIEDFTNKATIMEVEKRKDSIIKKIKEIYNESGLSLNDLLKYL